MVDEIPDGADVIFDLLGTRQCLPHEPRNALPQGAIEPFNMIGPTTLFADSPMSFGRPSGLSSFPEIAVAHCALAIDRW